MWATYAPGGVRKKALSPKFQMEAHDSLKLSKAEKTPVAFETYFILGQECSN